MHMTWIAKDGKLVQTKFKPRPHAPSQPHCILWPRNCQNVGTHFKRGMIQGKEQAVWLCPSHVHIIDGEVVYHK